MPIMPLYDLLITNAAGASISYSPADFEYHRTPGRYCEQQGAPKAARTQHARINVPGVDGVPSRNEGSRERIVGPFRVFYVAASKALLLAMLAQDWAYLEGKDALCTISPVIGTVRTNCILSDGYPKAERDGEQEIHENESGNWDAAYELQFECLGA